VGGGEHRPRGVERAGGVVEQVGRCQPEVDDLDALFVHTAGEGVHQLLAARAHVACDEHAISTTECGEGDTEGVCDVSIELVGHRASDVVRLDDLIQD
jgi:hypothetical protein